MSQGDRQNELQEKTQQLLPGPLKHVRAAALAAALLPLASVVTAPASAQNVCPSGGVCGFVWNDANSNGVQNAGETAIEGAKVYVAYDDAVEGTVTIALKTGPDRQYSLSVLDTSVTYAISVLIPPGAQPSPENANTTDDTFDSDGTLVGAFSVATVEGMNLGVATDFGFFTSPAQQPGAGTPGYWRNHPEAWPVASIKVGGITYMKAQAISWLGKVGKDKTTTMFSSLVPAMLNIMIHNENSCVSATIAMANTWMATFGPVGSKVAASSAAWTQGEPVHMLMDSYNNGLLCAPHRD